VDPVDQLELGIGLAELYLQTQICAYAPAFSLYVRQRLAAIDFGLPGAEQVQIWAIQNVDYRPHFVIGEFPNIIDLGAAARKRYWCGRGGNLLMLTSSKSIRFSYTFSIAW
jgi:hypothetical protein